MRIGFCLRTLRQQREAVRAGYDRVSNNKRLTEKCLQCHHTSSSDRRMPSRIGRMCGTAFRVGHHVVICCDGRSIRCTIVIVPWDTSSHGNWDRYGPARSPEVSPRNNTAGVATLLLFGPRKAAQRERSAAAALVRGCSSYSVEGTSRVRAC